MKILLINGSPNLDGCTYTGLKIISEELKKENIDSEIIQIGKKAIAGCIGCASCKSVGKCVFDDIANDVIEKLKEADGLVIGSPVYYASPNGNLISLLDRVFFASKNLEMKVGASIVSCRRGGATASFDCLNKYFLISNMPVAGSNYWNMIHGSKASDVYEDAEGVQTLRMLARNISFLVKSIKLGKENNLKLELEPKIKTNYIR